MNEASNKQFRSYAQNFEDVLLWRAFRELETGFYIDIGAQDPVLDSVSRGFYEVGWRGVHFEPHPDFAAKIRQNRPDEEVHEIAVSDSEGEMIFHLADGTGLSTGDEDCAEANRRMGVGLREIVVPKKTLASLAPLFVGKEVHWMKVDVEGMEERVLRGWDEKSLRPWVLVIEATLPGLETPSHHGWEPRVLEAGYDFAFFDGLNRFYVSKEHPELLPMFRVTVNVFDAFNGCRLAASTPFALELNDQIRQLRQALDAAAKRRKQMESSWSWRLTRPLRDAQAVLGRILSGKHKSAPCKSPADSKTPPTREPQVSISLDPVREPEVYLVGPRPDPADLIFPEAEARERSSLLPSGFCVNEQLESPAFQYWLSRLGFSKRHHRKLWELGFIVQSLFERGCLRAGARGLGFAVGEERLPALFAAMGCEVVATDLDFSDERARVWAQTSQHAADLSKLRYPEICPDDEFAQRVRFQPVDMNVIPESLRDFDFTWSTCSFEHCGSIEKGIRFLENQMKCLKPGGIAVHTTEFNLSSLDDTISEGPTVLFRRKDIESMVKRLKAAGHHVEPISPFVGDRKEDQTIDVMPYSDKLHLKLLLFDRYVSTSIALIIKKGARDALD